MNTINNKILEFQDNGFFIINNFVKAKYIDDFESSLIKICDEQILSRNILQTNHEPLIDLFKIGGEYRKNLYKGLQQIEILHNITNLIHKFFNNDIFFSFTKMDVITIDSSLRVDIPGERKYLSPVHQDIYPNYLTNKHIKVVVPLRDISKQKGTMKIYPGSHKLGYIKPLYKNNKMFPSIESKHYDKYNGHDLDLNAGSAIFFNPLLLHSSVPPSNWSKIKFISGFDVQDISSITDPNDNSNVFSSISGINKTRKEKRKKANGF